VPIRRFSKEYLERSQRMSPLEILEFLENYRDLYAEAQEEQTKAQNEENEEEEIRIRLPKKLLSVFRTQAYLAGVTEQAQIQRLIRDWSLDPDVR
jgi:predicted DNA binding CopG/RHH family protein